MSFLSNTKNKVSTGDRFIDLFPTPRFLEMPAPGLAFDSNSIRIVEFNKTRKGLVIKNYGQETIPPGAISDGDITDPTNLINLLKEVKKKYGLNHVRCALPEEKSYLFRGRVPKTSSVAELRTSVEFIIEENVPLSVSEAVFDYFVIEDPSLETNDTLDVAVSVVPRDLVESYVSILNSAGLSPLHFEIESQAIAKAVVKKGDKTPYLLINLFDRKIGIYVVSQEAIQFASTLPLTERPERKGEKIESEGEKQMTSKTSPIDIDIPIEEVKSETNKIISYWNSQSERLGSDKIPIETAVLSGKGADSKKLSRDLSFLNMKIRAADVWTNAFSLEDYIPSLPKNESLEYVVAVGLAIPNRPRS